MTLRAGLAGWFIGMAMTLAAAQQSPPGANPHTGALPGNEIGTGSSQPLSDKASNITPQDTRSDIAPNLPSPPIRAGASVREYLVAARSALLQGRTGETQQALEMAETRALDRSVPLFQTNVPSSNPLVDQIEQALHALSAGDRARTAQTIETAIAQAQ
jgi:hypothetical protein